MSDPSPSRASASRREGQLDRVVKYAQVIAGLGALLTALFLLYEHVLEPGPPPATLGATVGGVEVFPGVALRSYVNGQPGQLALARDRARAAGLDGQELNAVLQTKGLLVEYAVRVQGLAGQTVKVTRTLYDAATQERVPPGGLELLTPERLVTRSASDRRAQSTWMAMPRRPGRYVVEIDVVAGDGETLGKGSSRPFSLSAEQL